MKYLFYSARQGNFGDDLNPWLWPKLFGDASSRPDAFFLGIGSLLHSHSALLREAAGKRKIVFGTGVRPSASFSSFQVDDSWDIRFLRGPLSAISLGNRHECIADGAYAIRLTEDFRRLSSIDKKHETSLMPYFHSLDYVDWEAICRELGWHYISPCSERGVEHTLGEIAASRRLVSEAMHGAILADALRVPWHRFVFSTPYTEGAMVSDFKWKDWLFSIEIYDYETTFVPFHRNSRVQEWVKKLSGRRVSAELFSRSRARAHLLARLAAITTFNLAPDARIASIDERMKVKVDELKSELGA